MRRFAFAPVTAGVLLAIAGAAQADIRTTTFQVNAVVNPNCLVSATPMSFGTYSGTAQLSTTSQINVRCSLGAPYTLALSTGGGSFATRLLAGNGNNRLEYNLYTTDPTLGSGSIWGDGTSSTVRGTGTGGGMSVNNAIQHTVYGLLPNSTANQNVPTGTYTDTITVTVEY
jgi:spore coat protein U-like protein